jgi:ketosteroid isomerase-like protein
MSRPNVDLVRRAYDAFNRWAVHRHDPHFNSEAGDFLHPDVVFHTYANAPEAGVYRGLSTVVDYNLRLFEQFDRLRIDLDELVEAGDRVVVVSTQHAVPKGGGDQEILVHVAEVWSVRDGLLAERRSYATRAEAREAVGLRA